nr:YkgJ family cysteine cluster protein [uncultured Desulfuromonas sp.]
MISIVGWWRHLRLRLTGKELILTGKCRQCGACCRRLQLEQGRRWLRSPRAFKRLVRDHPEFDRFEICGRDSQGLLVFNCTLLGADNRCRDYDNRPQLCRDFPHKGIFFCGGALPPGCGYSLSEGISFDTHLRNARKKNGSQL